MNLVITQGYLPPTDPTAVIGRRIVAYLIDIFVAVVLFVVVFAIVAASDERSSAFEAEAVCDILNGTDSGYTCINADTTVILVEDADLTTLVLVVGIYFLATQLILPALTGFTPGKAIVGLRIVDKETFEKAGFGKNLVRWLLWFVDSAPWFFPLVGLITGLSSNGHRRVGDMAASTLVIDKKWVGQPMAVTGVNSVAAVAASPFPAVPAPFAPATPPHGSALDAPQPPPPGAPPLMPPPPQATSAPPPPTGATPPPPMPDIAPVPAPTPPPPVEPPPANVTEPILEPEPVVPTTPPVAPPAPAPQPETQPGIDAPQWDAARDTYIQWDPELAEWMEWNETVGAWVPISR
jgi:uncharacterized RDD family membrane protein YckC